VRSKVEQYFQKNRCAPAARNHAIAVRDSATACATGAVRDFSAITSNGLVTKGGFAGTPSAAPE
jgi:hypothetical protein